MLVDYLIFYCFFNFKPLKLYTVLRKIFKFLWHLFNFNLKRALDSKATFLIVLTYSKARIRHTLYTLHYKTFLADFWQHWDIFAHCLKNLFFFQGVPQLTGTTTVLVTVLDKNDNPPRFTRLFSVNVTENAEIGSFVIKVTSSDLDLGENANATYSFVENPGEKFKIDAVSGNVTVIGHLDREQQDEYLLKVAAVDDAWRAETPLTITIQDQNDNAPEFEHSYYSFNFPELQRSVVSVGQVQATDRDKQGPNSVISYSLQHPSDLFSVDPASGEIMSKQSIRQVTFCNKFIYPTQPGFFTR